MTGFLQRPLPGLRGWLSLQQQPVQTKGMVTQQQQICKVKEMIIYSQLCAWFNTEGKQFIKSCDQYSVTDFTGTSHTGFHKQHESVNRVPKSGRGSVTLSIKLGSMDSRSVAPCQTTAKNATFITAEVAELLSKEVIVETQLSTDSRGGWTRS